MLLEGAGGRGSHGLGREQIVSVGGICAHVLIIVPTRVAYTSRTFVRELVYDLRGHTHTRGQHTHTRTFCSLRISVSSCFCSRNTTFPSLREARLPPSVDPALFCSP